MAEIVPSGLGEARPHHQQQRARLAPFGQQAGEGDAVFQGRGHMMLHRIRRVGQLQERRVVRRRPAAMNDGGQFCPVGQRFAALPGQRQAAKFVRHRAADAPAGAGDQDARFIGVRFDAARFVRTRLYGMPAESVGPFRVGGTGDGVAHGRPHLAGLAVVADDLRLHLQPRGGRIGFTKRSFRSCSRQSRPGRCMPASRERRPAE